MDISMLSKVLRLAVAAFIGFAAGLLIATAERLFLCFPLGVSPGVYYGYGLLFTGFVQPIAVPLLWPARLLIPAAATSPIAASAAIAGNALLYAIAAAVAERIYARID
jgi:hypothetical protein